MVTGSESSTTMAPQPAIASVRISIKAASARLFTFFSALPTRFASLFHYNTARARKARAASAQKYGGGMVFQKLRAYAPE